MNVLIIYATVEGQTGKIAQFTAKEVEKLGHDVVLADAEETFEIPFDGVDAVILAAPVHQRRHPKYFEALIKSSLKDLEAHKTLLMSVSLNAAFPEGREEAQEYVVEMKMRTGFEPDAEMLVAGAVRTDHYDYFAMQVVRHVVLRNRDYDPKAGAHEFTDWQAISSEVAGFLG